MKQIFPPSPRYGIRAIFGTRGLPEHQHGQAGDLATDPTAGRGSAGFTVADRWMM
jgi:hypothetical protein